MATENLFGDNEWDVLLPADCRGCREANFELSEGQRLMKLMIGEAATLKACGGMIEYIEKNCGGLKDKNNPGSCYFKNGSFTNLLLTRFVEPSAIGPTDIVDR